MFINVKYFTIRILIVNCSTRLNLRIVTAEYYSIGKISQKCNVTMKTLCYYDKFRLLQPEYRTKPLTTDITLKSI